jgi:hypothetical protein
MNIWRAAAGVIHPKLRTRPHHRVRAPVAAASSNLFIVWLLGRESPISLGRLCGHWLGAYLGTLLIRVRSASG